MWGITVGVVIAALLLLSGILWLLRGARSSEDPGQHPVDVIALEEERAEIEASAASDSSDEDEGEDMPVPERGMIGQVTDPIPGRGYGEIKILIQGVELYFMAACPGGDWVEAGESVVVNEVRDGVVYVDIVSGHSADVDKD
jgi:hypothetical protein